MLKQHLEPIEKRGVLETLCRIISCLNEIFRHAATEELIEFNPADNLGATVQQAKNRICQHYPLPNSLASWLL